MREEEANANGVDRWEKRDGMGRGELERNLRLETGKGGMGRRMKTGHKEKAGGRGGSCLEASSRCLDCPHVHVLGRRRGDAWTSRGTS